MYSKNDYRYYLESRLSDSDDFLAHYGVKGMKWKHHLKKAANSIGEFIHPSPTVTFDDGSTVKLNNKTRSRTGKLTKKKLSTREPSLEERRLNTMRKNANSSSGNKTAHGRIDHIAKKAAYNTAVKQHADSQQPRKKKNVKIETLNTHKRTKKESDWNKEMQSYGREYLSNQNKSKKKKKNEIASGTGHVKRIGDGAAYDTMAYESAMKNFEKKYSEYNNDPGIKKARRQMKVLNNTSKKKKRR